MSSIINQDLLAKAVHAHLQAEMAKAGEKIVQEAVEKYEAEVRGVIAKSILTILDRSYSVTQNQEQLMIIVKHRDVL